MKSLKSRLDKPTYTREYCRAEGLAYLLGAGVVFESGSHWAAYLLLMFGVALLLAGFIGWPKRFVAFVADLATGLMVIPAEIFLIEFLRIMGSVLKADSGSLFALVYSYLGIIVILSFGVAVPIGIVIVAIRRRKQLAS